MDTEAVRRIEEEIAELERRWPAHSAPPGMWAELERLEIELEEARQETDEGTGGGEAGSSRLP
jgi:hypothetical protein